MGMSLLQQARSKYFPKLPNILHDFVNLEPKPEYARGAKKNDLEHLFPLTYQQPFLRFDKGKSLQAPLKVGVVLSGGQAPGGHNVISGLFDAIKKIHYDSRLFGFCDGPSGIVKNQYIEITESLLAFYRNQGGFDLIGSGRTKIETLEQFQAAEKAVNALQLDGLVIVGGDDSNTNAALLAEYFLKQKCQTVVVGVPKTIDGDLKNESIEVSFGFDTATKTYSEIIGSILNDTISAKKYYYFIKLMGRSASHITLECALQTHPNMALIGEEVEAENKSLQDLTHEISDLICRRADLGKNYGVILIPEGIIEFLPEFRLLIKELNTHLADDSINQKIEALTKKDEKILAVSEMLSPASKKCFQALPEEIQIQLLLDRDPHGNVQVSKIETERLFIELVKAELKTRKAQGKYSGKFSGQPHFCGYEGRSCLPSNFDSQYCYALGHVAALLIKFKSTGYMSCVQKLYLPVEEWTIAGIPLVSMMHLEERGKEPKPVIKKALVDIKSDIFQQFKKMRQQWALDDDYCNPGPIQFFGPHEITDSIPKTLVVGSQ